MALRILIVDDSKDAADGMVLRLQHEGFEVRAAYDGLQAITEALAFRPDVLILDLAMPSLDGFGVACRLRKMPEFAHKTFVALSGYSEQTHLDEASRAQFDEYLTKPPTMSTLLTILSEVSQRVGL